MGEAADERRAVDDHFVILAGVDLVQLANDQQSLVIKLKRHAPMLTSVHTDGMAHECKYRAHGVISYA